MITKNKGSFIHNDVFEALSRTQRLVNFSTKRYNCYSYIIQDNDLYNSTEGKRLIDILTNGSELDITLIEEILNARKNTLQE